MSKHMMELADEIELLAKLDAMAGVGSLCAINSEAIVSALRQCSAVSAVTSTLEPKEFEPAIKTALENWFGENFEDMDEEKHRRKQLFEPLCKAVASVLRRTDPQSAPTSTACECGVLCQDLGTSGGCRYGVVGQESTDRPSNAASFGNSPKEIQKRAMKIMSPQSQAVCVPDLLKRARQFVADSGCDEDDSDVNEARNDLLSEIDAALTRPKCDDRG